MTGTTKAWLGRFGEVGHPYTHPTAKQCNYSYSHPTTKQCNYSYTHPSTKQCDAAAGSHTHTITGSGTITINNTTAGSINSNTGSGFAHENRPPYYALCFIMKQ